MVKNNPTWSARADQARRRHWCLRRQLRVERQGRWICGTYDIEDIFSKYHLNIIYDTLRIFWQVGDIETFRSSCRRSPTTRMSPPRACRWSRLTRRQSIWWQNHTEHLFMKYWYKHLCQQCKCHKRWFISKSRWFSCSCSSLRRLNRQVVLKCLILIMWT